MDSEGSSPFRPARGSREWILEPRAARTCGGGERGISRRIPLRPRPFTPRTPNTSQRDRGFESRSLQRRVMQTRISHWVLARRGRHSGGAETAGGRSRRLECNRQRVAVAGFDRQIVVVELLDGAADAGRCAVRRRRCLGERRLRDALEELHADGASPGNEKAQRA
jgi:hypothetical protein